MPEKARIDALAFLQRSHTGALATAGHDGHPHSSVVHYHADEKFNVYFLTLKNSRKYQALIERPEVAFTVFTEEIPQTLQIEGTAKDISLSEEVGLRKDELFDVLNKNQFFYPPVTKLDINEPAVIWIQPKWIRWADYAFSEDGESKGWNEIPIEP